MFCISGAKLQIIELFSKCFYCKYGVILKMFLLQIWGDSQNVSLQNIYIAVPQINSHSKFRKFIYVYKDMASFGEFTLRKLQELWRLTVLSSALHPFCTPAVSIFCAGRGQG